MKETREPLRCPMVDRRDVRPDEPLEGCGSTKLSEPDREGLIDCINCGLWFDPVEEYGPNWSKRYYIE